MKTIRLNMHDAKTHLSRHLAGLEGDDRIILCNRNRPVAEVRLIRDSGKRRQPGVAKGAFIVSPAFFESLPEETLSGFEGG